MTTKSIKILENVHPLSLIKEVQKWPVLYSRNSGVRGNLYFKTKVWHEVAKSVFDDWETCTEAEKDSRVNDLAKRWRNLRDTFKREVELERKVRDGYESKKKRYVYFEHMLFLLPHMSGAEQREEAPDLHQYFGHKDPPKSKTGKRNIEQHFIEEAEPPRVTKSSDVDDIDEDRHFALSLIPTLKKMCDDDKLIAKMEILKVLRNTGRKRRKREEYGEATGPVRSTREEFGEETDPVRSTREEFVDETSHVKMEFLDEEVDGLADDSESERSDSV